MTREADLGPPAEPWQNVVVSDSLGGLEQQLPRLRCSAADHHLLRVEGVDHVRDPDSQALSPDLDGCRGGWVSVARRANRVWSQNRLPLSALTPQRRVRGFSCCLLSQAAERV